MKKLFTLLIFVSVSILSFAQITPADVGLPDEVYNDLKNVVFSEQFEQCSQKAPGHNPIELTMFTQSRTVNGVTTKTEEVVIREFKDRKPGIRTNVGVYALNHIIGLYHDNGYKQVLKTDSGYIFQKANGSQFVIWTKDANWFANDAKWYSKFAGTDLGFRMMHPKTKQSKLYTSAELMQMKFIPRGSSKPIPVTMAMIEDWSKNYRIGYNRDPTKYVCNLLTRIVKLDNPGQVNGTYRAELFVNGININNINEGALITSFGKTGLSFAPRWKFLNECSPKDGGKMNGGGPTTDGTMDYGNGGTCGSAKGTTSEDFLTINVVAGNSFYFDGQTVTFDATKRLWLWSMNETFQAQGKNEQADGYYDVTQQKIRYSLFGN